MNTTQKGALLSLILVLGMVLCLVVIALTYQTEPVPPTSRRTAEAYVVDAHTRVRVIGGCEYIETRYGDNVTLVHKQDCPNHR